MNNPTAFPRPSGGEQGMTLRDYFAAKAVQGMMASSDLDFKHLKNIGGGSGNVGIAMTAYKLADAMLAEREKGAK